MTGQHTPGPWRISDNNCEVRPEAIHAESHGAILATTWAIVPEAERVANASLIAASPDLLQACKAFVASDNADRQDGYDCELCGNHRTGHADDCPYTEARAAIAPAEGVAA